MSRTRNDVLLNRGEHLVGARKSYCLNGIAGLVSQRRNRKSGALIGVYDSYAQGIDSDFPWATVCELHGYTICSDSLRNAQFAASNPDWCEECQKNMASKSPHTL